MMNYIQRAKLELQKLTQKYQCSNSVEFVPGTPLVLVFDVKLAQPNSGWIEVKINLSYNDKEFYPVCDIHVLKSHDVVPKDGSIGAFVSPLIFRFSYTGQYRIVVGFAGESHVAIEARVSAHNQIGSELNSWVLYDTSFGY